MAFVKPERSRTLSSISEDDLPVVEQRTKETDKIDSRIKEMEKAVVSILEGVGEDPAREGLVKTPHRAAKAFHFFTKGYEETLEGIILRDNQ